MKCLPASRAPVESATRAVPAWPHPLALSRQWAHTMHACGITWCARFAVDDLSRNGFSVANAVLRESVVRLASV